MEMCQAIWCGQSTQSFRAKTMPTHAFTPKHTHARRNSLKHQQPFYLFSQVPFSLRHNLHALIRSFFACWQQPGLTWNSFVNCWSIEITIRTAATNQLMIEKSARAFVSILSWLWNRFMCLSRYFPILNNRIQMLIFDSIFRQIFSSNASPSSVCFSLGLFQFSVAISFTRVLYSQTLDLRHIMLSL